MSLLGFNSNGSAIVTYDVDNNGEAVTDEERAATTAELLNAINPNSNTISIGGNNVELSGNPVLVLDDDSEGV